MLPEALAPEIPTAARRVLFGAHGDVDRRATAR